MKYTIVDVTKPREVINTVTDSIDETLPCVGSLIKLADKPWMLVVIIGRHFNLSNDLCWYVMVDTTWEGV